MMGLVPFYEHDETRGLTLCCMKTQAGDSFCEPGSRHQNSHCPDLGLAASRTVRDTRLWYLMIAAPADQTSLPGRPQVPRSHCGQGSAQAPTRDFAFECRALPPVGAFWPRIRPSHRFLSLPQPHMQTNSEQPHLKADPSPWEGAHGGQGRSLFLSPSSLFPLWFRSPFFHRAPARAFWLVWKFHFGLFTSILPLAPRRSF